MPFGDHPLDLPFQRPAEDIPRDIVATPIEGIRLWALEPTMPWELSPDNPYSSWNAPLGAIAGYGPWVPGHQAICWKCEDAKSLRITFPKHEPPEAGCKCGYWALRNDPLQRERLYKLYKPERFCIGTALLWGKIIEGENGYRAQYARPNYLYLLNDQLHYADRIKDAYKDIEIEVGHFAGVHPLGMRPNAEHWKRPPWVPQWDH